MKRALGRKTLSQPDKARQDELMTAISRPSPMARNITLLSITQGHSTDRPVLTEVLRRHPEIPYVGVIGSASKRAVLMAWALACVCALSTSNSSWAIARDGSSDCARANFD